jgi:hypothetical protein
MRLAVRSEINAKVHGFDTALVHKLTWPTGISLRATCLNFTR